MNVLSGEQDLFISSLEYKVVCAFISGVELGNKGDSYRVVLSVSVLKYS